MPGDLGSLLAVLSKNDPSVILRHGQMHVVEPQHLAPGHHRERETKTVQLVTRQITVQTLQVRPVLVVAPRQGVPDHIRHSSDQFPRRVLAAVDRKIHGVLDDVVELCVHGLGVAELQRWKLGIVVDDVGIVGDEIPTAREGILHGTDENGEQGQIGLGAVLQLVLEDLDDRGDAGDGEEALVLLEEAHHGALLQLPLTRDQVTTARRGNICHGALELDKQARVTRPRTNQQYGISRAPK